jgi:hypothetical protein
MSQVHAGQISPDKNVNFRDATADPLNPGHRHVVLTYPETRPVCHFCSELEPPGGRQRYVAQISIGTGRGDSA